MSCLSMMTLTDSIYASKMPCYSAPYFDPKIKLNFDQSGLSFKLVKNEGEADKELGFDLTHQGALELGRAIFSYFGENYYNKYQQLKKEFKMAEIEREFMPKFYSVWVVKFAGDNNFYDWQDGARDLETKHLTGEWSAFKDFRPYSSPDNSLNQKASNMEEMVVAERLENLRKSLRELGKLSNL